jgi:hypothetical protein
VTVRIWRLLAAAALVGACAAPLPLDTVVESGWVAIALPEIGLDGVAPVMFVSRSGPSQFGPNDRAAAQMAVERHCVMRGQTFGAPDGGINGLPDYSDGTWIIAGACI